MAASHQPSNPPLQPSIGIPKEPLFIDGTYQKVDTITIDCINIY
jgi:hypothetical protein